MFREPDLTPTPKVLDWHCETVTRGSSVIGIVVGKLRKARCHVFGKLTKPCLSYASDGQLPCPCETRRLEIRDQGYLPIVTAEREQKVIVLSSLACEQALEFCKQGRIYRFLRPKAEKSRIRISLPDEKDIPRALLGMRPTKDRDILEYLCHVWQLHALTKWCGFTVRRPLKTDAVQEIAEPEYEPRFLRGRVRVIGRDIGTPEVA